MKKMITCVLLCSLLLTLAACGGSDGSGAADAGTPPATAANVGTPPVLPAPDAGTPEGGTGPEEGADAPEDVPEEQPEEQPAGPEKKPAEKPREKPAEVSSKPVKEEESVLEPSSASSVSEEAPKEQAAPPEEQPAEQPAASAESAASYIGKNVSSLISALGNPLSRTYAPSCLGDGEDGELTYSGFTVYTYREGDSETVQAVE